MSLSGDERAAGGVNDAVSVPGTSTLHRVGPYDVETSPDSLTLRLENRGQLSLQGCFLLVGTMLMVLLIGVLSIVQAVENTPNYGDPIRTFTPQRNHFGFLWLFGSALMLVLIPIYVSRAYKSALSFSFCRSQDVFARDSKRVARLSRVEYFRICESRDPDGRYLYLLDILYNDGQEMLLHNCYDEREIMNLANELSAFVGCGVRWA